MHQRLFGGPSKSGSSNGASEAYSNLPPQQRCRKIQARLDDLAKEAATKEQSRAGLEKMFGVYKENPKLGNASDVDQQMKQYAKELEVIYAQVENYRKLLLEAQSELNTPMGGLQDTSSLRAQSSYNPSPSSSPPAINNPRSSYSGESVSSGVSEGSSSTVPNVGAFARPQNTTSSSNGFHSISPKIQPPQQPPIQHIDSNSADFYEECDSPHQPASGSAATNGGEDLVPLGTCTAIYGFDGSTDGTTMEMREGDEMLLIEKDEGDGWTRVRHMNSQMEGFVPTSYLQCRWY
uniref:SH3 domain-containing protein n=1 Tax=Ditylenchus dipsaci TaxID=166011 RepID=A0A915DUZ3_9BILA